MCAQQSLQWRLTLCDPMDCSPPGSCVHGILQARILEWVAMPFSRGASPPRDRTHVSCVSCTADRFFTAESPGKPQMANTHMQICLKLLVIRKIQTKTTMRYHFMPTDDSEKTSKSVGEDVEKLKLLHIADRDVKW